MKVVLVPVLLMLSACATRIDRPFTAWSEPNEQGLGIKVDNVKLKRKKVAAEVTLINNYNFEVVIPENSVRAQVDGQGGYIKRSNKRVVLAPSDRVKGVYVFLFDSKTAESNQVTFKAEYVYKGTESTTVVTESSGRTIGSAVGTAYQGVTSAIGASRSNSKSVTNEMLSFKEGDRLKPVSVSVDVPSEN